MTAADHILALWLSLLQRPTSLATTKSRMVCYSGTSLPKLSCKLASIRNSDVADKLHNALLQMQ